MAIINGTGKTVYGTNNADTITVKGPVSAYGLGGNDHITGDGSANALSGDAGNDTIKAGNGNDALFGGDGDDQLYGEGGDDKAWGGPGNDYLHGGSGNDKLRGEEGNDILNGGSGNNDLSGGAGNDTLIHYSRPTDHPDGTARYDGGTGTDTLIIDVQGGFPIDQAGADLAGYTFVDVTANGTGTIRYGTDPVEPQTINVASFSGIENFKLADDGNPVIFTADTTLTVTAGSGDQAMLGASGDQTFIGGIGEDSFIFAFGDGFNGGHDVIKNFDKNHDDIGMFVATDDIGDAPYSTAAVESNGHTIYTSTSNSTGEVLNVLDVDAIGLPAPYEYYDMG